MYRNGIPVLASAIVALALVAHGGTNEAVMLDCIWVKLPVQNAPFPPDEEFFKVVNTAAIECQSRKCLPEIGVLSDDTTAVSFVRIVLSSYGIPSSKIVNARNLPWNVRAEPSKAGLIGEFSRRERRSLKTHGYEIIGIPLRKTERQLPQEGSNVATVAIVVLGNQPLDDSTPTVDMIRRVLKGVEVAKQSPGALLLLTGGKTVGNISEAEMMALIALSRGMRPESVVLEEAARGTDQNARLCAEILSKRRFARVLVVSKSDHLEWAMPLFREYEIFRNAEPLPCEVDPTEVIAQMRDYLKTHDNERVRRRLSRLLEGLQGVD